MDSTINFVCFSFFGDLRQRCQFYFQFVICVGFISVPLRRCSILDHASLWWIFDVLAMQFSFSIFFLLEVFDVDPFGADRSEHTSVRSAINN